MPVPTKLVLSRRDLVSPVYLAGSFTQWQANLLMDVASKADGNEFTKTVELEPGVHQFKFRLGEGDWWITDDVHEKVTDESGNVNNVIDVKEVQKVEAGQPVKQQVDEPSKELPKDHSVKEAKKDIDVDDKPSIRWSTRSKATSDDTTSSSNLTVVETSSLLKNRTTTNYQTEILESVTPQNHDRAPEEPTTNGIATNRVNDRGSAKSSPASPKSGFLRRLFCFCSSATGLSLAGFGTVLVAAYMLHSQVN